MQNRQIADFNRFLESNPSGQLALLLFIQQERQALQDLLSIAIDFHRVHPEVDMGTLLSPYEDAISEALDVPMTQARQLFSTVLGELVRGLLGVKLT